MNLLYYLLTFLNKIWYPFNTIEISSQIKKLLIQCFVYDRLTLEGPPAITLPCENPIGYWIDQVLRIGEDDNTSGTCPINNCEHKFKKNQNISCCVP
jgi:hypothetical protein